MAGITQSEILDAIRAAVGKLPAESNDAFTTHEMSAQSGIAYNRLLVELRALKLAGKLECVSVRRERIDGRNSPVPGYRLLGEKKKAQRGG